MAFAWGATVPDDGVAVIVVSSDIDEVLGLSDRVMVVADGRIVHAAPAGDLDAHAVLDRILSGNEPAGNESKGDAA